MPNWLVKVFDHDKNGDESQSGYFVSEPDELEATLTGYDAHAMSAHLHEGTDEVPNIELEEAKDLPNGSWITNLFK
jgi:hypothetical protein